MILQLKNSEKVCAVVVTFNRKELLIECLNGLCSQSLPIDSILIIDNASTDGTEAHIQTCEYIENETQNNDVEYKTGQKTVESSSEDQILKNYNYCIFKTKTNTKIYYVKMKQNTGGAGGFHEGVKLSYKLGFDWIWLMDDDVEPAINAHEEIDKYKKIFSCMQCNRINLDGTQFNWEQLYFPYLNISIPKNTLKNKNFSLVNTCSFEGFFLKRDVIEVVGLPPKDYFIRWDDLIYGYQCSEKFEIALLRNAILKRKLNLKKNLNNFSVYYELRNRIITRRIINKQIQISKKFAFIAVALEIYAICNILLKWNLSKLVIFKAIRDGYGKKM